jgi:hypothetical protein
MSSFQGREPPRVGLTWRATNSPRQEQSPAVHRDHCRRQAVIRDAAQTYCRTPPFSRIAAGVASTKLIYLLFFPIVFRED